MNESLILIIAILISGGIGAYIGMTINKLKNKSDSGALIERESQLGNTITGLKETLNKIELDREEIRNEKDFLNTELARKNSEIENLRKVVKMGAEKARESASKTVREVREIIGYKPF